MGLMPWCPYSSEEKFEISSSHVILTVEAPEELRNEYSDKFGSGIITVTDFWPVKKGIKMSKIINEVWDICNQLTVTTNY